MGSCGWLGWIAGGVRLRRLAVDEYCLRVCIRVCNRMSLEEGARIWWKYGELRVQTCGVQEK